MPRGRKTILVDDVKAKANVALANHSSKDAKGAICAMIESVLMETNNYNGFCWLQHVDAVNVKPEDDDYYDRRYY